MATETAVYELFRLFVAARDSYQFIRREIAAGQRVSFSKLGEYQVMDGQ
jgi:hypothetical protein